MSEKPEISTEELLERSPFKGDLDAELAPKPPKMKLPGLTLWLGAAVIAVVGFLAGTQADQAWGSKGNASNNNPTARGNGQGGGQFPGGGYRQNGQGGFGAGGGGFGGGFTAGTVVKVEGDTVFLKTTDGKTIQVKTTGTTQIRLTKDGKAADLKAGSTVTVRGETGSDGSMTATAVTEGSGIGGGAGGFGRGGGGQQQPTGN
jgi:hypothetical protein